MFDPDRPVGEYPAIWRAVANTAVVTVLAGASCSTSIGRLLAGHRRLVDRTSPGGRHLVVDGELGRHRIFMPRTRETRMAGYLVEADGLALARLAALASLHRDGAATSKGLAAPIPSANRRRRLELLLAILDRLGQAGGRGTTTRELAGELIYPHHALGSAIEWKSSSQRRQVQRLVAEARFMRDGGFRDLLR
ncbi:DNA -binding domain-containing protein [Erythrobacter sp.]|uniref:DNA -binding domain-containing protein n=1 Tax=Erythrobacter sp. TaxID=1042 RepID=UPI00311E7D1A